ncbi:hypothetical protein DE146DRAFT_766661 [Phaeosphaeria sp. MPI-PUGE-AT-0046c]|nr:hypothetical protein DE146DRAFT_766661 [Phaeosphaeria sp. MPI-PUGE-AT-0046c]
MSDAIEKAAPSLQQDEKLESSITSPSPSPSPLYSHTFFSKEAAQARKALVPGLVVPVLYNALLLCACLALFLGSLIKANDISHIRITVVNLDDGVFGDGLVNGIKSSLEAPGPHLRWTFVSAVDVPNDYDAWSRDVVLDEKAWAVLQISRNASANLQKALEEGDGRYDPSTAATLYFTSARNQVTTLSLTVPAIVDLANNIVAQIALNMSATYLESAAPMTNIPCPRCLVEPFAIRQTDLIPFSSTIALGPLSTGLIFLLTFTFQFFTILRAGASTHGHLFTLPSTLTLRTCSSLSTYLFLSLCYTLVLLAFSLPLTGHFSSRPSHGFMALWMLNFLTMAACGFVLEAASTLAGMQFAPFFLNGWLIANASPAFGAHETMPRFYRYGYAMPFWHAAQATRTLVFGTKSHIGLNFGVLLSWCVVGWVGVVGATAWRLQIIQEIIVQCLKRR